MLDSVLRPRTLALREIEQAESLGHDCSDLRERLKGLPKYGLDGKQSAEAMHIYSDALALGLPEGYPYVEPSELGQIRQQRPDRPHELACALNDAELHQRTLGGWLGRVAGCLLGKPVEGWTRQQIRQALLALGEYPLADYFPEVPPSQTPSGNPMAKFCTRGHITHGPRDDDTDYTVLNLHLLEALGLEITPEDVGKAWLRHLPFRQVCTAERVAYRNLIAGLEPPETAVYQNPYREWIGAQIRADAFGYAGPGMPAAAAELAFRDAALSHVANGIYGEMWVAAMLAGAFVSSDPREVIEIGLGEIPHNCRIAQAIRKTVQWCGEESDWERVRDHIEADYGSLHRTHTINNACLVALGLMKADGEFGRGVCISVMGGWDTDCNGATTGSVLGVMYGADGIELRWVDPLNDTLTSAISGFAANSISELARRTVVVSKKVIHDLSA